MNARVFGGRLAALIFVAILAATRAIAGQDTRYLAFQIFTGSFDSPQLRQSIPPSNAQIAEVVDGLVRAIGTTGSKDRYLGFIIGPISFDNSDDDVRRLMHQAFRLAREKEIAVGFHIDDSMFWGRLPHQNIESSM